MSELLITGATVLDGSAADVLVRDGVIAEIGSVDAPASAERVEADGLVLLPVDLEGDLCRRRRDDLTHRHPVRLTCEALEWTRDERRRHLRRIERTLVLFALAA